jgi:hypothetical protein
MLAGELCKEDSGVEVLMIFEARIAGVECSLVGGVAKLSGFVTCDVGFAIKISRNPLISRGFTYPS